MSGPSPLGAARLALAGEARGDASLVASLVAAASAAGAGAEAALVAWELAAFVEPAGRASAARLVLAVELALRRGSTRVDVADRAALAEALALAGAGAGDAEGAEGAGPLAAAIEAAAAREPGAALAPLVGPAGDLRPLVVAGGFLYPERAYALEGTLLARLEARLAADDLGDPAASQAALADVLARPARTGLGAPLAPNAGQRAAVETVLRRPLATITGGPGTGKTTVVLAIVRALVRLGVDPAEIALAAPTGKAAHRLASALRDSLATIERPAEADVRLAAALPPSLTVHRLLGWSPARQRFRHHARSPLPARVVIVDESSMLDLALAERVLAATSPDARLVLLGDADQLPSVDAGAVFRDLCPPAAAGPRDLRVRSSARLVESMRMRADDPHGSRVLAAAGAILRGDLASAFDDGTVAPRASGDEVDFAGVEHLAALDDALLDRLFARLVDDGEGGAIDLRRRWDLGPRGFSAADEAALRALLRCLERAKILCAVRADAARANRAMHARAGGDAGAPFAPGEPVIVLRNDYERGLFNGDQGVVVRVRRPGGDEGRVAVFARDDGLLVAPVEAGPALEPAWAITVHRAQGSEHDAVVVVLPRDDVALLGREILYTAVTRARRGAVLVGPRERLVAAAARRTVRSTGLEPALDGTFAGRQDRAR